MRNEDILQELLVQEARNRMGDSPLTIDAYIDENYDFLMECIQPE